MPCDRTGPAPINRNRQIAFLSDNGIKPRAGCLDAARTEGRAALGKAARQGQDPIRPAQHCCRGLTEENASPSKHNSDETPGKLTTSAARPGTRTFTKHWHKHRSAKQTDPDPAEAEILERGAYGKAINPNICRSCTGLHEGRAARLDSSSLS